MLSVDILLSTRLYSSEEADIIFLDFQKAFDQVPHGWLLRHYSTGIKSLPPVCKD